jgi:hypothetical protein
MSLLKLDSIQLGRNSTPSLNYTLRYDTNLLKLSSGVIGAINKDLVTLYQNNVKLTDVLETNNITGVNTAGTFAVTLDSALTLSDLTNTSFTIKFDSTVASASNPKIKVNALAAFNLKQYNNAGLKVASNTYAGQVGIVQFDGSDFLLLNPIV